MDAHIDIAKIDGMVLHIQNLLIPRYLTDRESRKPEQWPCPSLFQGEKCRERDVWIRLHKVTLTDHADCFEWSQIESNLGFEDFGVFICNIPYFCNAVWNYLYVPGDCVKSAVKICLNRGGVLVQRDEVHDVTNVAYKVLMKGISEIMGLLANQHPETPQLQLAHSELVLFVSTLECNLLCSPPLKKRRIDQVDQNPQDIAFMTKQFGSIAKSNSNSNSSSNSTSNSTLMSKLTLQPNSKLKPVPATGPSPFAHSAPPLPAKSEKAPKKRNILLPFNSIHQEDFNSSGHSDSDGHANSKKTENVNLNVNLRRVKSTKTSKKSPKIARSPKASRTPNTPRMSKSSSKSPSRRKPKSMRKKSALNLPAISNNSDLSGNIQHIPRGPAQPAIPNASESMGALLETQRGITKVIKRKPEKWFVDPNGVADTKWRIRDRQDLPLHDIDSIGDFELLYNIEYDDALRYYQCSRFFDQTGHQSKRAHTFSMKLWCGISNRQKTQVMKWWDIVHANLLKQHAQDPKNTPGPRVITAWLEKMQLYFNAMELCGWPQNLDAYLGLRGFRMKVMGENFNCYRKDLLSHGVRRSHANLDHVVGANGCAMTPILLSTFHGIMPHLADAVAHLDKYPEGCIFAPIRDSKVKHCRTRKPMSKKQQEMLMRIPCCDRCYKDEDHMWCKECIDFNVSAGPVYIYSGPKTLIEHCKGGVRLKSPHPVVHWAMIATIFKLSKHKEGVSDPAKITWKVLQNLVDPEKLKNLKWSKDAFGGQWARSDGDIFKFDHRRSRIVPLYTRAKQTDNDEESRLLSEFVKFATNIKNDVEFRKACFVKIEGIDDEEARVPVVVRNSKRRVKEEWESDSAPGMSRDQWREFMMGVHWKLLPKCISLCRSIIQGETPSHYPRSFNYQFRTKHNEYFGWLNPSEPAPFYIESNHQHVIKSSLHYDDSRDSVPKSVCHPNSLSHSNTNSHSNSHSNSQSDSIANEPVTEDDDLDSSSPEPNSIGIQSDLFATESFDVPSEYEVEDGDERIANSVNVLNQSTDYEKVQGAAVMLRNCNHAKTQSLTGMWNAMIRPNPSALELLSLSKHEFIPVNDRTGSVFAAKYKARGIEFVDGIECKLGNQRVDFSPVMLIPMEKQSRRRVKGGGHEDYTKKQIVMLLVENTRGVAAGTEANDDSQLQQPARMIGINLRSVELRQKVPGLLNILLSYAVTSAINMREQIHCYTPTMTIWKGTNGQNLNFKFTGGWKPRNEQIVMIPRRPYLSFPINMPEVTWAMWKYIISVIPHIEDRGQMAAADAQGHYINDHLYGPCAFNDIRPMQPIIAAERTALVMAGEIPTKLQQMCPKWMLKNPAMKYLLQKGTLDLRDSLEPTALSNSRAGLTSPIKKPLTEKQVCHLTLTALVKQRGGGGWAKRTRSHYACSEHMMAKNQRMNWKLTKLQKWLNFKLLEDSSRNGCQFALTLGCLRKNGVGMQLQDFVLSALYDAPHPTVPSFIIFAVNDIFAEMASRTLENEEIPELSLDEFLKKMSGNTKWAILIYGYLSWVVDVSQADNARIIQIAQSILSGVGIWLTHLRHILSTLCNETLRRKRIALRNQRIERIESKYKLTMIQIVRWTEKDCAKGGDESESDSSGSCSDEYDPDERGNGGSGSRRGKGKGGKVGKGGKGGKGGAGSTGGKGSSGGKGGKGGTGSTRNKASTRGTGSTGVKKVNHRQRGKGPPARLREKLSANSNSNSIRIRNSPKSLSIRMQNGKGTDNRRISTAKKDRTPPNGARSRRIRTPRKSAAPKLNNSRYIHGSKQHDSLIAQITDKLDQQVGILSAHCYVQQERTAQQLSLGTSELPSAKRELLTGSKKMAAVDMTIRGFLSDLRQASKSAYNLYTEKNPKMVHILKQRWGPRKWDIFNLEVQSDGSIDGKKGGLPQ